MFSDTSEHLHSRPNGSDWHLLVIDDEKDILDVVSMMLTADGYAVATASDGEEGLRLCRRRLPDIVITDIRMPRKDGLEVLAQVKSLYPDTEVIVATAFGEVDLAVKALQLDASDFITKPISSDALAVAIERAKARILTRRKLQQQMANQVNFLHQDKMISLGRLAASVAHEINNPLAGVLNYLRLMIHTHSKKKLTEDDRAKFQTYLVTMEKEVDRCTRIVGNLLAFARKSDVIYQDVDLKELVDRCMSISGHRLALSHIEVSIDIKEPLPLVRGDANQLQQCLINLIFNAADAMPDGGRLELRVFAGKGGQDLFVTVADNGCGIAAKDLPHIFEPFFTTKKAGQGTGLGLSTTFEIIESHHGMLSAQSRPHEKTVFTIRLPAKPET